MRLLSAFWWWWWWSCGLGAGAGAAAPPAYDVLDFDWSTITPGANLKWHACYGDGEFQCARLLVPLDWTTANATNTIDTSTVAGSGDEDAVAIAMIKLPAAVPDDDPSFGGTIFTNPGGPGGSGVRHALANAHVMRDIADRPGSHDNDDGDDDDDDDREERRRRGGVSGGRHYEILSWDPRGVLFTTPQVDCFDGDLAARYAADLQRRAMGSLDGGLDVVRRQHARAKGLGHICAHGGTARRRDGSASSSPQRSILPFLSTASVARDMVEMVDRIHELRREEAASAAARPIRGADEERWSQKTIALRDKEQRVKRGDEDGNKLPRIQYWGFSYGSVLGNTFASMYPDRVGRMIVVANLFADGIADADDYMAGTWLTNLQDTEKIVDYFYETCFSAGAEHCPLRRPSDATGADMKARVDALVRSLDEQPAVVVLPDEGNDGDNDDDNDDDSLYDADYIEYGAGKSQQQQQQQRASMTIVTGYEVLSAFRRPVYAPLSSFRPLARALASALDHANYTAILQSQFRRWPPTAPGDDAFCKPGDDKNNNSNRSTSAIMSSEPDAARAILCGDGGAGTARLGPDGLQAYVEALRAQSPTLGPYWATIRFECAGWAVRPRWRFTGPFGTPAPLSLSSAHVEDDDDDRKGEDGDNPDTNTRGDGDEEEEEEEEEEATRGRGGEGGEGRKRGGRPSAPLLFVTSRLDPVTPRRNAHAMAAAHAGAAVLEVDAVGHCGSTVPSRCARAVIRDYLEFGRVVVPTPTSSQTGTANANTNTNTTTIRCAADGFDPWAPPLGPEEEEEEAQVAQEKKGGRRSSRRRIKGPVDLQATWPEGFWV
ncbi:hypothetical protein SLS62_008207 [Diatrype stigma]|uniref:Peptidase S33 tripeptidyl aminopeptidase-like C-terminal domain-containing protein n=1 Tax=Diatrype stigma TaxID=117547 RepID=A0AAN9UJT2_9PEZI